jgi:nucleoside-diphosphate-sugar epimerase
VRGFVAIASADDAVGQVTNIGSDFEVSIGDTARLIAETMGVEITIESDDRRLRPKGSEVERLWADASRARKLGWAPEFAGMEGFKRGLAETIGWFTEPENLARYKAADYNI